MSGYKHIETSIARYIAGRYQSALEIGTGANTHTASLLQRSGVRTLCTDIHIPPGILTVPYQILDICSASPQQYEDYECLYAIRPIEEMMANLIKFAKTNNQDLFVYHLGFEGYSSCMRKIDCGIILCQYVIRQN
jgi:uncharacterized protein